MGAAGCSWAREQRELLLRETGDLAFWPLEAQAHASALRSIEKQISYAPFNGQEPSVHCISQGQLL